MKILVYALEHGGRMPPMSQREAEIMAARIRKVISLEYAVEIEA